MTQAKRRRDDRHTWPELMVLLFDTHLLIWAVGASSRLPLVVRDLLDDSSNNFVFSVASLWEVAIKRSKGYKDFQTDPRLMRKVLLDVGYRELPIQGEHALAVTSLPPIHKDPFDRMLVAQAMVEGILLLTVDATLLEYPAPVRLV